MQHAAHAAVGTGRGSSLSTVRGQFRSHNSRKWRARDDFLIGRPCYATAAPRDDAQKALHSTQSCHLQSTFSHLPSSARSASPLDRSPSPIRPAIFTSSRTEARAGDFARLANPLHRCSESLRGPLSFAPSTASTPRLPPTTSPHPHLDLSVEARRKLNSHCHCFACIHRSAA